MRTCQKERVAKYFFPAEFSKLAQVFSSSQLMKASDSDNVQKYKKLLEDYVNNAVKKTKQKSKKNEIKNKKKKKN